MRVRQGCCRRGLWCCWWPVRLVGRLKLLVVQLLQLLVSLKLLVVWPRLTLMMVLI